MKRHVLKKTKKDARKEALNEACAGLKRIENDTQIITDRSPRSYQRKELYKHLGKLDYEIARKQIEKMRSITFGHNINVLLFTDRLYDCARGLKEYLSNSADISVALANDSNSVKMLGNEKPFDFLIYVGMLEASKKYVLTMWYVGEVIQTSVPCLLILGKLGAMLAL